MLPAPTYLAAIRRQGACVGGTVRPRFRLAEFFHPFIYLLPGRTYRFLSSDLPALHGYASLPIDG
jgi:hypothetical protein